MESDFTIVLTAPERQLVEKIEFNAATLAHDRKAIQENGERACQLMEFLIAREEAIPAHRVSYFTDPDYNIGGRNFSWKQTFERNGTQVYAIFRHPHFLPFLRYFIFGPDLPSGVLTAFRREVEACHGPITSGDVLPLAKFARQQARANQLDPRTACEEFFKLGLEYGLGPDWAAVLRRQVRTIR
ncbi:MAG: hypothetical protein MI741_22920 [Rhodospirillales bacterium]|nr:hypothetical protein [Rhodospirillales bacterium]